MTKSETFAMKADLLAELKENMADIQITEEQLYMQRKQRPYNVPYIKMLLDELKYLQINKKHIIDRMDKLDGCF